MPAFTPETLAAWTGGTWTGPAAGPVRGLGVDSRRIGSGEAFVALATGRRDGHDFVAAAAAAGAAAAIVAREVPGAAVPQLVVEDPLRALQAVAREHRRRWGGTLVGVTGSAGKTSTKELLATLLGEGALATEGNLNNHIGVPLTLLRLETGVHALAVIEAGISAPGEMAVLAGIMDPDAAVVTLVGPAHLEELGGLEGVAREKAVLPAAVRPGGWCLFPAACARHEPFAALERSGRAVVLEPAAVPAVPAGPAVPAAPGRLAFTHVHDTGATTVTLGGDTYALRRVSDGMAGNAALAIAAALRLGVSPGLIRARLQGWGPAALRGEWREDGRRRIYVDCYNANPAAMADALESFCSTAPSAAPRLYVVGCMEELGSESGRYHRELGRDLGRRLAPRPQDRALVVGTWAAEVRDGAGAPEPGPIEILEEADAGGGLAARVAAFSGWVFLKGSRRYGLERALPGSC